MPSPMKRHYEHTYAIRLRFPPVALFVEVVARVAGAPQPLLPHLASLLAQAEAAGIY